MNVEPAEAESASEAEAIQALEALIIGNPDMEELELLLSEFNLFEAVGMVRQELRHSHFLAFLLDPNKAHGLGDAFVTRLLQAVLLSARGASLPVSPLDLDVWSLDETTVQREWQHVDILLLNEAHRLAVVIENKVDSAEHSDQLARYHEAVRRAHPEKSFFGIYLTPDGEPALHPEYLSCSYRMVAKVLEDLMASRRSTMGEDVRIVLRHYHEMLHRHIVSESRIAELCQRIYRKHQQALDLIFEHKPDLQSDLSAFVRDLLRPMAGFTIEQTAKASTRFILDEWDAVAGLGNGDDSADRLLFFYVYSGPAVLDVKLYLGPGRADHRQAIMDLARSEGIVRPNARLGKNWNTLARWPLLNGQAYQSLSREEMEDRVRKRWRHFAEIELPRICEHLSVEKLTRSLTP